jgi:hypothetical protein
VNRRVVHRLRRRLAHLDVEPSSAQGCPQVGDELGLGALAVVDYDSRPVNLATLRPSRGERVSPRAPIRIIALGLDQLILYVSAAAFEDGLIGFDVVGLAADAEALLELVQRTLPPSPDDHRRLLAVITYLNSQ